MSDLRDYILSRLYEMAKAPKKKVEPKKPVKTEPSHEDQEDFAKWQDEHNPMSNVQQEAIDFSKKTIAGKAARKTAAGALKAVKSRFQQAGLAKKPGDAAKLTKQYSQETYKHRESIAAILSDKLEELKQSTVDSAAAKRVAQVRSKDFRGEEKPVFKGGTGGTDKPEQIGTRSSAGKGVIGKRLSTLYKGKTSKGVAAKREDSSTNLKDRMVDILLEKKKVNPWAVCHASTGPEKSDKFERCVMDVKKKHGIEEGTLADRLVNILAEAFIGTTDLNMEHKGKKEGKAWATGSRANMLKKSRTLSSVVNKQPSVQKARAEAKAEADKKPKPTSGGYKPSGPKRTQSGSYFKHRSGKDVEI